VGEEEKMRERWRQSWQRWQRYFWTGRVAFDHRKTEAVLFQKSRDAPAATIWGGTNDISFNPEATCWLGVWLDSQLTLKEDYAIRLKQAKTALGHLRRLAGQMGLGPVNCRKV
jgi:hypothetical protein